jgi:hypothetical protein
MKIKIFPKIAGGHDGRAPILGFRAGLVGQRHPALGQRRDGKHPKNKREITAK